MFIYRLVWTYRSGVAQVPNAYYYVYSGYTPDLYRRALLKQGYDMTTWGPDSYWSTMGNHVFVGEYWRAWREYPGLVLSGIIYRWRNILSFYNSFYLVQSNQPILYQQLIEATVIFPTIYVSWIRFTEHYGLLLWLLALVLYFPNRSLLFALILPIGMAILSIGTVYYEPRYVLYGSLSYLLATLLCVRYGIEVLTRFLKRSIPRYIPVC